MGKRKRKRRKQPEIEQAPDFFDLLVTEALKPPPDPPPKESDRPCES